MGYIERRREAAERMAGYYAEAADHALEGRIGLASIAGRTAEAIWTDFLGRKENSIAFVAAEAMENGASGDDVVNIALKVERDEKAIVSPCAGCNEANCGKCHSEPKGV